MDRLRACSSSSTSQARRGKGRALAGPLRPPAPKKKKLGLSMQTGETNRYAQPASITPNQNSPPLFLSDGNIAHQDA